MVLIGLLVFGLRPTGVKHRGQPRLAQRMESVEQTLPEMDQQQLGHSPYGTPQQAADVGQNPYQ